MGFRNFHPPVADGHGGWHGCFRPKIKNGGFPTFSGGTVPARRWHRGVSGLSEAFSGRPTRAARLPTVLDGLGRPPDGDDGLPGRRRAWRGCTEASGTHRTAFCGLSKTSSGPRRFSTAGRGLWSASDGHRPAGRGIRSRRPLRVYPITKLGRRCRKFWGGCSPSFSDTVHPGMEKPRRRCRGLVLGVVRRRSLPFLGPPSRSRRAPSQPRSS